jgi:hypothetical protein
MDMLNAIPKRVSDENGGEKAYAVKTKRNYFNPYKGFFSFFLLSLPLVKV